MNNSYESVSTVSHESSYDPNMAFFEDFFTAGEESQSTKKYRNKVLNFGKCLKICSKLIRKLNVKPAARRQQSAKKEEATITKVLLIDLNSNRTNLQVQSLPNSNSQPSINFNSQQFAFVGDIFYCYI